jgi:DNA-binding response OmpR family regulator
MTNPTEATILLAEEDDVTRVFLHDNLTADGYQVLVAPDRSKALALLSIAHPDLVVVDVNGQTLALLDAVRSGEGVAGRADPDTPLIVLSRDADRLQRVRMLERGSDDVIKKPFAYPELRARIGAVLRRSQTGRCGRRILRVGPLMIDVRSREVRICDRRVELSAKEYELLLTLAGEPDRVFTRQELLQGLWGYAAGARTRTLDSHASRLRHKLCDGTGEKLIVNVWGVGYRLMDRADARIAADEPVRGVSR